MITLSDFDFISGFDCMSGLRRTSVDQNDARVAELLSYGATRAKTAKPKKKVKAHSGAKS